MFHGTFFTENTTRDLKLVEILRFNVIFWSVQLMYLNFAINIQLGLPLEVLNHWIVSLCILDAIILPLELFARYILNTNDMLKLAVHYKHSVISCRPASLWPTHNLMAKISVGNVYK